MNALMRRRGMMQGKQDDGPAHLVPGVYDYCTVADDFTITTNGAVSGYIIPLSHPVSVNAGDVIQMIGTQSARLYNRVYANEVANGNQIAACPNVTSINSSFTAVYTGSVDRLHITLSQTYRQTAKWKLLKNGEVFIN